jgi:hypothetical protein
LTFFAQHEHGALTEILSVVLYVVRDSSKVNLARVRITVKDGDKQLVL